MISIHSCPPSGTNRVTVWGFAASLPGPQRYFLSMISGETHEGLPELSGMIRSQVPQNPAVISLDSLYGGIPCDSRWLE